ncbi:MAG: stage II sporulation protein M [Lachnospiraceae bacterium]|nr:stage II sporulation protein M [Lachnospiraceae bacterium]
MVRSFRNIYNYKIPSICITSILLVLGGVAAGYFVGWLFRHNLLSSAEATFEELFQSLDTTSVRHTPLFLLCIKQQVKYAALLVFFALTNAWLFYLCGFMIYTGFNNGLLLSFCVQLGGQGGWWDFFCLLLPHCLIYIPVYLVLVAKLHTLRHTTQKRQSLLSGLPLLLLCLLILCIGCIAETFINPPLLQWYHGL